MLERRTAASRQLSYRLSQQAPEPFVFVPISKKEAAKGRGAAKRIVRAHVTRLQHAKSTALSTHEILNWTVLPNNLPNTPPDLVFSPNGTTPNSTPTEERSSTNGILEDESEKLKRSCKPLQLVLAPTNGTNLTDPFWTYPVEYESYLSPIFAHYIQNIAVEIPDLDGPKERNLLRRSWFPLAMTDPATMYSVLLMAASHYCLFNPSQKAVVDLLALKARALSEINAALRAPDRALSDALIGAVAKMVAFEAINGDAGSFEAHRKGLQHMIKLRGGLSTLGLDGLLERMLVWIDLNASHLTGLSAAFGGESFPTEVSFAAPDPWHFAGLS